MNQQASSRRERPGNRGFTLVELIAVLGIVTLLSAFSIPAIEALGKASDLNESVSSLSLTLAEARAYAMAHDTYVWVGMMPNNTAQNVVVGAVAGTTGQAADIGNATTYLPISKVGTYPHLGISAVTTLEGMNSLLTGIYSSGTDITSASPSAFGTFQQNNAGTTVTFGGPESYLIQFAPNGEAKVATANSHWIQIGLQPLRGASTSKNVAVLQLATLSGQVEVARPEATSP